MSTDIHAAIAQAQTRPTVTQVLDRMMPDITRSTPAGLDPDRVARLALTAIRTSELAKAKGIAKSSLGETTPESFAGSLLTAAALGLEPNTPAGEAYLIPYQDRRAGVVECQLIIGYQGLVKLFRQHPMAMHIGAQAVYENDAFDYQHGSDQFLRYRPALGDRGDVIAYYADAKLTNGAYEFTVLSVDQVKALRRGKVGPSGDIPDPERWMERKTALRQLLKLLPKRTALDAALSADEQPGSQLQAQQVPQQVMQSDPPAIEAPGVDTSTGEVFVEPPVQETVPAEEASPTNDVRGDETGQSGSRPSGERRASSTRSQQGQAGGSTGDVPGEGPEPEAAADRPKITTKQRSALMAKWTELGIQRGDRDERLLITCSLLGLEPGALNSTSDLDRDDASRLIDVLKDLHDRDDLDRKLAGQESLTGGGQE